MMRLPHVYLIVTVVVATALLLAFIFFGGAMNNAAPGHLEVKRSSSETVLSMQAANSETASDSVGLSQSSSAPNSNSEKPTLWFSIAFFFMSFATLASVATAFYLYRWRRVLLANPQMLLPEELGAHLKKLSKSMERLNTADDARMQQLSQQASHTSEQVVSLMDSFSSLQRALDEKDLEISRLRKGYDVEVYRKYLGRLIKIDRCVREFVAEGENSPRELKTIQALLEDALEDCGVEIFAPDTGADFRHEFGVAERPTFIKTDNPSDNFKIYEVKQVGYRVKNASENRLVSPAQVVIQRYGD